MKSSLTALFFAVTLLTLITSCKKDKAAATNPTTCSNLTNDVILMDGVSYVFQPAQAHNCGSGPLSGGTIYSHFMSVHDGTTHTPGVSFNQPDISIVLSSLPPAGMTTTYTFDNAMWLISSTAPPINRASLRMGNYYTGSTVQNWFSDEQSGTIDATADASGNVTLNFTSIKLVQNGGSIDVRKIICGKNIICH